MRKRKSENTSKEQPQLSKEEHQSILDIALDQSKVKKLKQQKAMNPILKEFFLKHKVLIAYRHGL